jgi:hypothetical protein
MHLFRTAALLAALSMTLPARGLAQRESPTGASEEAEPRYRNKVSGFIGVTLEGEEAAAFTLGADYERRLGGPFGVGVLVERAFGDARFFLAAAGLFWHPLRHVRLDVAPGIEWGADETLFVLRIGADYDVELTERWSIGPNVNLDFVSGRTVWVLGAEVGYSF